MTRPLISPLHRAVCLAAAGLAITSAPLALAQQASVVSASNPTSTQAGSDPAADTGSALKFGSVLVAPSLGVRYGHDNNVTQAPDSGNKISSAYWLISPSIKADYQRSGDTYALTYDGAFTRYVSSSEDNTNSNTLRVNGNNRFDSRNAINWLASYQDAFDARGSTDTPSGEPNRYRQKRYGGTYRFGAESARGRVELDAFGGSKRYLTNPADTSELEYDTTDFAMRFLVRVMPKTSLILEVRELDTDYVAADSTRNSKETSYRVGATWSATAATSGTIKFGQTKRDYADPTIEDFSGSSWDLIMNWAPRTYSRFDITASRAVSDTTGAQGDFLLNTTYGIKWKHNWVSYLRTELGVAQITSEYVGNTRRDKQLSKTAGVYYDFRRWMSVGLEVALTDRDSNEDEKDFDRRQTTAVVQVKF